MSDLLREKQLFVTHFGVLRVQLRKHDNMMVVVDLSPPSAVREGVSLLFELISIHDGMMVPA